MAIDTEFMFEMQGTLGEAIAIGPGPEGVRSILPVVKGRASGPALNAEILPGTGADWARVRADGSFALDVRLVLKAENGDLIYMTYGGRIAADTEAGQACALDFAKPDPASGADQYYFRINPLFETASESYAWMNRIIAIGSGRTGAGGVTYRIYKVN